MLYIVLHAQYLYEQTKTTIIINRDTVITDYLLTVKTSDFSSVSLGDTVTTSLSGSSTAFEVRTKRMIDDGTFSQITLSKT